MILLRVEKGALVPADAMSIAELRERRYAIGDHLVAELKKSRSPQFHRFMHRFAALISDNIEEFSATDAHAVLKRLQLEANIGCDEIALNFPGIGPVTYRIPRSLSFSQMEDGEFRQLARQFSGYVVSRYWPSMAPEQVEAMAESLPVAP